MRGSLFVLSSIGAVLTWCQCAYAQVPRNGAEAFGASIGNLKNVYSMGGEAIVRRDWMKAVEEEAKRIPFGECRDYKAKLVRGSEFAPNAVGFKGLAPVRSVPSIGPVSPTAPATRPVFDFSERVKPSMYGALPGDTFLSPSFPICGAPPLPRVVTPIQPSCSSLIAPPKEFGNSIRFGVPDLLRDTRQSGGKYSKTGSQSKK